MPAIRPPSNVSRKNAMLLTPPRRLLATRSRYISRGGDASGLAKPVPRHLWRDPISAQPHHVESICDVLHVQCPVPRYALMTSSLERTSSGVPSPIFLP